MDENKPGWKKTEFWIKAFTVDLPILWMSIKGFLPVKTAMKVELIGGIAFMVFNTIQKGLENWKTIHASQTTVTTTEPLTTVTTPA